MTEAITSDNISRCLSSSDTNDTANNDGDDGSIIIPHFENDANLSAFSQYPVPNLRAMPLPRTIASRPYVATPPSVTTLPATSAASQLGALPIAAPQGPVQQPVVATNVSNPIPGTVRYRDEICRAAQAHGLDPLLLAGVAAQETGGPGSNSGSNVCGADGTGHGVFQIDSGTWQSWLSTHHNGMDVAENADKAASILADNLKATGGDVKKALHLYNAGSASVPTTRTTWAGGESLDYESSVMRHIVTLEQSH